MSARFPTKEVLFGAMNSRSSFSQTNDVSKLIQFRSSYFVSESKNTDHVHMSFTSGDVKRSYIRSNLGTYYGLSEVRLGKEIGVTKCCHVPDEMYYS